MKLIIWLLMACVPIYGLAQVRLSTCTQSSAGGTAQMSAFTIMGSAGLHAPPGLATSAAFTLGGGFIATRDALAPIIQLGTRAPATVGQPVPVSLTVTDNVGVSNATLFYRKGGEASFNPVTMTMSGNTWQCNIPDADVGSRGLDFYVQARDGAGNLARSGIASIQVQMGGQGIVRGTSQPGGGDQTAYRLISIPLAATNNSPTDVLSDNLGAYDNTKWRFFELKADQTLAEYPNTSAMSPGRAFWLIVRDAGKVIDTGPGETNITSSPFAVNLNRGWTLIGNPFNYSIPISKLALAGSSGVVLRSYAERWNDVSSAAVTTMEPFEGYAVYDSVGRTLTVDPNLGGFPQKPSANALENQLIWSVKIHAQCQQASDIDNIAAIAEGASEGLDRSDLPEPPPIGSYVSVHFVHPEWPSGALQYCVDARPERSDGTMWDFEAASNIDNKLSLTFHQVASVPERFKVLLVDKLVNTTRDLRQSASYEYSNRHLAAPRPFALLVGTEDYIQKQLAEMGTKPTRFELFQNFPNPFNPTTTIRYSLPIASHVTLKVYTLLGQEVGTLVAEMQEMGYKAVEFDARELSSGVYFYRIKAGDFSSVRKLLVLK